MVLPADGSADGAADDAADGAADGVADLVLPDDGIAATDSCGEAGDADAVGRSASQVRQVASVAAGHAGSRTSSRRHLALEGMPSLD